MALEYDTLQEADIENAHRLYDQTEGELYCIFNYNRDTGAVVTDDGTIEKALVVDRYVPVCVLGIVE